MKKRGWIVTGVASLSAALASVYVINKVRKHRQSQQEQHLIHFNDELDQPLQAMETMDDDQKIVHTIHQDDDQDQSGEVTMEANETIDPSLRNEQIMREVKRMSINDHDEPLKSDDELMETKDDNDVNVVNELQSVYSHLTHGFIVESIGKCERFAQDFKDRSVVTIKYHVTFDTTSDQLAFDQTIKSLGYTSEQGLLDDQMSVKSVITLSYVKLLSDVLTVANQVNAAHGHLLGYEVE